MGCRNLLSMHNYSLRQRLRSGSNSVTVHSVVLLLTLADLFVVTSLLFINLNIIKVSQIEKSVYTHLLLMTSLLYVSGLYFYRFRHIVFAISVTLICKTYLNYESCFKTWIYPVMSEQWQQQTLHIYSVLVYFVCPWKYPSISHCALSDSHKFVIKIYIIYKLHTLQHKNRHTFKIIVIATIYVNKLYFLGKSALQICL